MGSQFSQSKERNGYMCRVVLPDGASYDGLWQDDKKHGYGVMVNPVEKSIYRGQWQDDKKHGLGKLEFKNGEKLEGSWMNDVLVDGKGVMIDSTGTYTGQIKNDCRHGEGRLEKNGTICEGIWDKGQFVKGVYTYPSGNVYTGECRNFKKHGQGVFEKINGEKYDGKWMDNYFVKGVIRKNVVCNSVYEGESSSDVFHGRGVLTYSDGDTLEGVWKSGRLIEGKGVLKDLEKKDVPTIASGEFRHGYIYNGVGGRRLPNGDFVEGKWQNGQLSPPYCNYTANQNYYTYEGECNDRFQRHGRGVRTFQHGVSIDGYWKNNNLVKDKDSIVRYTDGTVFTGQCNAKGVRTGFGKLVKNGKLMEEGKYTKNKLVLGVRYVYFEDGSFIRFDHNHKQLPDQLSLSALEDKLNVLTDIVSELQTNVDNLMNTIC